MPEKPTTAAGYRREHVELVKATCLYVATKLGDLADEVVVVGGLVPSLLIAQDELPTAAEPQEAEGDLIEEVIGLGRYGKTLTMLVESSG